MTWKLKLLILTKGLHHSQITHMMHCMILKPQDVFITLKLVALGQRPWSYIMLANELFMSASEINAGVKRATKARLLAATSSRFQAPQPIVVALEEFLIHGVDCNAGGYSVGNKLNLYTAAILHRNGCRTVSDFQHCDAGHNRLDIV